jgi:hypothetical protein
MNTLERLIMRFPVDTLRKVEYAWFGIVVFFVRPPIVSGILAICLLLSLIILKAQRHIWEANVRHRCQDKGVEPYIDRPRAPFVYQGTNLLLLLLVGFVLAYLFGGTIGLSGVQWFLIVVGFSILKLDWKLFGAPTVYIVTDQGIGLGHGDVKLFVHFDEIAQVVLVQDAVSRAERWNFFTPTRSVCDGALLVPENRTGFTRFIERIFLAPTNQEQFLKVIPPHLVADHVQY